MIVRKVMDCKKIKWKGRRCKIKEGSKEGGGWVIEMGKEEQKCSRHAAIEGDDFGAHLYS